MGIVDRPFKAEYPAAPLLLHAEEAADHPAALIVARGGEIGQAKAVEIILEIIEFVSLAVVVVGAVAPAGCARRITRSEAERRTGVDALMPPAVATLNADIDAGPVLDRRRQRSGRLHWHTHIGRRSTLTCNHSHR